MLRNIFIFLLIIGTLKATFSADNKQPYEYQDEGPCLFKVTTASGKPVVASDGMTIEGKTYSLPKVCPKQEG